MTQHPTLPDSVFRSLVHFAPDAFLVVNGEGAIVFANAQAESLFGYLREDLVGAGIDLLLPDRLRHIHAAHRAEYWEEPRPRPMGSRLPLVARRRDGTEVPVEVSLSPVYTDERMYVTASVRDVTERRRIEEALQASEERYRLLAEHAQDVIFRISLTESPPCFEYVSPSVETLTGYPAAAFYREPDLLTRVTHPDDRALLDEWFQHPREVGTPFVLRAVHRDGHVVWHEERFVAVEDEDGAIVAIEGIARDITEQRALEEERRLLLAETEIERERERIASDLHDGVMQTMYSAGLQLSSFLHGNDDLPADSRRDVEEAIEALNNAIGDIRRYVMDLRPVDFTGELGESLGALLHLFESTSGLEVTFEEDPDLPVLDESSAVEVFLLTREALSNVQRHADASNVTVRMRRDNGALALELEDDGAGFDGHPPAESEHLGLRSMANRARLLGGELQILSEPGGGTTVRLRMPLQDGQDGAHV